MYGRQPYLYNEYYPDIIKETKWLAILDLDEFLYSPDNTNINHVLNKFDEMEEQEFIADWYWFGSNGYKTNPENIVDSFTKRGKLLSRFYNYADIGRSRNWCCKSFAKTKNILRLSHHFNYFKINKEQFGQSYGLKIKNFNMICSENGLLYINHYIQSETFYMEKIRRGSCNNEKITSMDLHNKEAYNIMNQNDVEDNRLKEQTRTIINLSSCK